MVERLRKMYVKKKPVYSFHFLADGKAKQRHREDDANCNICIDSTMTVGYIRSSSVQLPSSLPYT